MSFESELEDELCGAGEPEPAEQITVWTDLPGVDLLVEFCRVTLTEDELDLWREKLVPRVCELAKLDEVDPQVDLLASFDERFSEAVQSFLTSVSDLERRDLLRLPGSLWKLNGLVQLFDDLLGVDPQAELRVRRRLRRQPVVAAELAGLAAAQPAAPTVPVGFVLFRQDPGWEKLLPAAQRVFRVMFSRATNRSRGKGLSCGVSVGLLMKATGYSARQVKRGLAQLRAGGWIGYVVHQSRDGRLTQLRGRPMIGCSRYWVVRHPDQLVKS